MPTRAIYIQRRVSDPRPGDRPDYKVYRSRPRRVPASGRRRPGAACASAPRRRDDRSPRDPREPGRITPGRVLKWVALAVVGWLLLSLVLFMVSAQLQEGVVGERTRRRCRAAASLADRQHDPRPRLRRRARATRSTRARPGRARRQILLLHAAFGSVRKLSIPRDSFAEIPGHGLQKINAAYAIGGAGLMIETVEGFLGNGLKMNHIVEVDFEDFPELIDSLGGITVNNKTRICSPPFDNFWEGFHLPKGERRAERPRRRWASRACGRTPAPRRERPRPRGAPAGGAVGDPARAGVAHDVLPAAADLLAGAARRSRRTWRARPVRALRRPRHRELGGDPACSKPSCLGCGPGSSLLVSDAEKKASVDELLGN